jgi:hypothetical protein
VHEFSVGVQKISGKVQNDLGAGAHLPSKSGQGVNIRADKNNRKGLELTSNGSSFTFRHPGKGYAVI